MKYIFEVTFRVMGEVVGTAVAELDEAVIKTVSDDWRDTFCELYTPEEIVGHIVGNMVLENLLLDRIDGWGDQPASNANILRWPDLPVGLQIDKVVAERYEPKVTLSQHLGEPEFIVHTCAPPPFGSRCPRCRDKFCGKHWRQMVGRTDAGYVEVVIDKTSTILPGIEFHEAIRLVESGEIHNYVASLAKQ